MSESDDVSRRRVVQGIAAGALFLPVLQGCRMEDPDLGFDLDPDAPGATSDAVQGTGFTVAGDTLTIDLTHPLNTGLGNAGGSRIIPVPGDKIMVVRTAAADDFETLSAVCTHQRCSVRFVAASTSFACPCHNSKFAIDGSVTAGPAARDLRVYANAFDGGTKVLTVTLA
jgi:cytochrome b6-f complex iron-sulfur subunit